MYIVLTAIGNNIGNEPRFLYLRYPHIWMKFKLIENHMIGGGSM